MTNRKGYSADFEAMVALTASREELMTAELAKKYGVYPTMIGNWKKHTVANMASVFVEAAEKEPLISQRDGMQCQDQPAGRGTGFFGGSLQSGASILIHGVGGKRR